MSINIRRYKLLSDFEKVSDLLRDNYGKYEMNGNICQSRWEYAHTHPCFNHKLTHRFGVWEEINEIVGIAFYEMDLGDAFLCTKKGYEYLKNEMIDYAMTELSAKKEDKNILYITVYDYEKELKEVLSDKGFELFCHDPVLYYDYSKGFQDLKLPEGFEIFNLNQENDIKKIHNVLWKGFDHEGEADDDLDCRLIMQSGPSFNKELTTIIKAPNGEYACFAGMWVDGKNDYAYIEPLATDPKYRGLKLASIALTESMKKSQKFGATYCTGGYGDFYTKYGFEISCHLDAWKKVW